MNEVAKAVGTKKEAQEAVGRVLSTITEALKRKESVSLAGFGTLKVDQRKARKGRNHELGQRSILRQKTSQSSFRQKP